MEKMINRSNKGRSVPISAIFIVTIIMEVSLMGCTSFKQYKQEAENMCSTKTSAELSKTQSEKEEERIYPRDGDLITTDHLNGLPEIVQHYLVESGIVGQTMVSTVQLRQTGKIRIKPDASWMEVNSVETFNIELSEFKWYADVKMNPLVRLTGYDKLQDGKGAMRIKLYDIITVVDASGPSFDQEAMVRYLNELMWLPKGYLHPAVKWRTISSKTVEVSLSINGITVSGIIEYNNKYMDDGKGNTSLEKWETPIDSWREYHGVILPEHGYASWMMENFSTSNLL